MRFAASTRRHPLSCATRTPPTAAVTRTHPQLGAAGCVRWHSSDIWRLYDSRVFVFTARARALHRILFNSRDLKHVGCITTGFVDPPVADAVMGRLDRRRQLT